MNLRRSRRAGRLRLRWRAYAVLAVAVYCAAVGWKDMGAYLRLRAQLTALRAEERALRAQAAAVRARIAYAQTPGYVAAAARQEFGLVAPNQIPLAPLQAVQNQRPGAQGGRASR